MTVTSQPYKPLIVLSIVLHGEHKLCPFGIHSDDDDDDDDDDDILL